MTLAEHSYIGRRLASSGVALGFVSLAATILSVYQDVTWQAAILGFVTGALFCGAQLTFQKVRLWERMNASSKSTEEMKGRV